MSDTRVGVGILVFPETTASVVYGMLDLFRSADRDWGVVTRGRPGPELIRPWLVARGTGALEICNVARVFPDHSLADCPPAAPPGWTWRCT